MDKINWENNEGKIRLELNYSKMNRSDFFEMVREAMSQAIEQYEKGEIKCMEISISDIPSYIISDEFDMDPTDFNGWQGDWWDGFYFNGHRISVFGGAWYATANLTLE